MLINIGLFFAGSFFEILGCYSFFLFFREEKNSYWLAIGLLSLIVFAYLLTRINLEQAGRIYAIYGGIYIFSSLLWLVFVEKEIFNRWDILGAFISFIGVIIIYLGNKSII